MAAKGTLALALSRVDAHAFDEAAVLLERAINEAAREGESSVETVARAVSELTPLFGHPDVYRAALPFYETAVRSLTPLLAAGDSALVECKQHLALVFG